MSLIVAEELSNTYDGAGASVHALRDVSLRVERQAFVAWATTFGHHVAAA